MRLGRGFEHWALAQDAVPKALMHFLVLKVQRGLQQHLIKTMYRCIKSPSNTGALRWTCARMSCCAAWHQCDSHLCTLSPQLAPPGADQLGSCQVFAKKVGAGGLKVGECDGCLSFAYQA